MLINCIDNPAPIYDISASLGLADDDIELYGKYKAKVEPAAIDRLSGKRDGKLILVTAINPTPAGEGKTTTSIGLSDALRLLGRNAMLTLREPSMGPVFGVKGGATGGGKAQVLPAQDINLHFTGDIHAVGAANNLLAAMIDNHIFYGNKLGIDPRTVTWRRCIDMNDRQLRAIVSGLSGKTNGVPREDGFDITAASEIMAIMCLSRNIAHLKQKLERIIVGRTYDGVPVTAGDIKAHGALASLLTNAIKPNLVQTAERTPAFIHGGPFANIAHGCNSVIATKAALKLADIVVTEAGFGADLGAEKFCDIKCGVADIFPSACVIVASVRALKHHGGAPISALKTEDPRRLEKGLPNLFRHIDNMKNVFHIPTVVAINRFPDDTSAELSLVRESCADRGAVAVVSDVWANGGEGGVELAEAVLRILDGAADQNDGGNSGQFYAAPGFSRAYDNKLPIREKIGLVAKKIYGADGVDFSPDAQKEAVSLEKLGYGELPVCMAKTQYSFSDDPKKLGAHNGFRIGVRAVKVLAGAGFIVATTGDIMTLPGLPKAPAAERFDVGDDGAVTGLL